MKIINRRKFEFVGLAIFLMVYGSCCFNQRNSKQQFQMARLESKTDPVESKKNPLFLKYTTGIRSIFEDSKGNIWFGSHQEGVCLFDGENFTYFNKTNGLSDNQIRSIYEDKNGFIWFECGEGISSFDGQKITTHTEKNYDAKKEWHLNDGDLWFKGDKATGYNQLEGHPGVYQVDGEKISYHVFPIAQKKDEENYYSVTTPFVIGKKGNLWFGTYGAVIGYDGLGFKIIDNKTLGLNEATGLLHIRCILEDSKGNLWIGNNGIGVFRYDGVNTINFTEQHKLKIKNTGNKSLEKVFSIGEDGFGNIWFGTSGSGVWKYNGESLKNFTENNGLESNLIWTIYRSKQGEIWFGGANPSAVYKFNGIAFERKY